jgi:DNA-binding transcriptional LysR family regulator
MQNKAQRLTLKQLRVLDSLARLGSATRVAEALHVTQPAVSIALRQAEALLGTPLTQTVGRGLRLTQAGQAVAESARAIEAELLHLGTRLDALKGLRGGTLRLAAVSTSKYFVPKLLRGFLEQHGDAEFEIVIGNRATVLQNLHGGNADLAIVGQSDNDPRFGYTRFADNPLHLMVAGDHPLARRRRLAARTVLSERMLVRETGSGMRADLDLWLRDQGLTLTRAVVMRSDETIKQSVLAGLGVALMTRDTVAGELAAGRVVELSLPGLPVRREWHLAHAAGRKMTPLADAFREHVVSQMVHLRRTRSGP